MFNSGNCFGHSGRLNWVVSEMSDETLKRRRGPFFWVGMALWVAVFATVFVQWRNAQTQIESAGQATGGAGDVGQNYEGDAKRTVDEEKPTVQITWSDAGLRDFEFTDTAGGQVTKNDFLGKPWVASFIFTRCAGTCPRVTNSMDNFQRRYKDQPVRFVTFTVDPENDTVEVLKQYSEKLEVDPDRWVFLTGDKTKLYSLINQDFLMPAKPADTPEPGWEVIHTNNVCLVDATGRVVGKYNSLDETEMAKLRRDLDRQLQVESVSDGESSTPEG